MQTDDDNNERTKQGQPEPARPTDTQPEEPEVAQAQRADQAESARQHAPESTNKPIAPLVAPFYRGWRFNKELRIFDALLTVASFIGLVFLAQQSCDLARQTELTRQFTDVALKQLEATDRPWLSVDVRIAAPFRIMADSVHLSLAVNIKNVGNSVATHIENHMQIFPQSGGVDGKAFSEPIERQKALCDQARMGGRTTRERSFRDQSGIALFPNEQSVLGFSSSLSHADMALRAATFNTPNQPPMPYPGIIPAIIGCLDYRFGSSERHHQTGFIYQILRIDPEAPLAGSFFNLTQMEVPVSEMRLDRFFFGGNYAD